MATRRTSNSLAKTAAPAAKKAAPRAAAKAAPAKAPAKAHHGGRPALAQDEEHHRHERSVSIAATQHVVRSKSDGTIIARICVQSEHVLYGARDSKMWRRVTLGDFAAFMEQAGELVKNWDGGN